MLAGIEVDGWYAREAVPVHRQSAQQAVPKRQCYWAMEAMLSDWLDEFHVLGSHGWLASSPT